MWLGQDGHGLCAYLPCMRVSRTPGWQSTTQSAEQEAVAYPQTRGMREVTSAALFWCRVAKYRAVGRACSSSPAVIALA